MIENDIGDNDDIKNISWWWHDDVDDNKVIAKSTDLLSEQMLHCTTQSIGPVIEKALWQHQSSVEDKNSQHLRATGIRSKAYNLSKAEFVGQGGRDLIV